VKDLAVKAARMRQEVINEQTQEELDEAIVANEKTNTAVAEMQASMNGTMAVDPEADAIAAAELNELDALDVAAHAPAPAPANYAGGYSGAAAAPAFLAPPAVGRAAHAPAAAHAGPAPKTAEQLELDALNALYPA